MIQIMKVDSLQDVCDIVSALIKNRYICETKSVYKKSPRDRDIDYFEISYWIECDEEDTK